MKLDFTRLSDLIASPCRVKSDAELQKEKLDALTTRLLNEFLSPAEMTDVSDDELLEVVLKADSVIRDYCFRRNFADTLSTKIKGARAVRSRRRCLL